MRGSPCLISWGVLGRLPQLWATPASSACSRHGVLYTICLDISCAFWKKPPLNAFPLSADCTSAHLLGRGALNPRAATSSAPHLAGLGVVGDIARESKVRVQVEVVRHGRRSKHGGDEKEGIGGRYNRQHEPHRSLAQVPPRVHQTGDGEQPAS